MKRIFTAMMLAASGAAVAAASNVSLASDVFVERVEQDAAGRPITRLAPPRALAAGDRLVFVLSYRNRGVAPANGFVITNPVPDGVAFAGAEDQGAEVSLDGGRTWHPAGSAMPAGEVTHIRWQVRDAVAAGATGQLSYRAIAR